MDETQIILEKYRDIVPDFENFIESMRTPQPYWLRVNTLKISEEKLVSRLTDKGFVLKRYREMNAYQIASMPVKHPGATREHALGYYYVQDLASMMPVLALNPKPEDNVLDMAAAPGSKTTQMAQIMQNTGTILANDINIGRLKSLAANVERLGTTNVIITRKNAASASFGTRFDKILLDAPCSGEGTLRKAPPARVLREKDYMANSKMQKEMLKNAAKHLKEDGKIVYSTCTFNPLENEEVVRFGVETLSLKLEATKLPVPAEKGVREWNGITFESVADSVLRIYPHRIDTGGMFIAVLRK
ncbi:MAG: RsmB/NOP family class I SAM-dependent RNA methyltransferase [Euryarchaeota archaeon]|nr:RsmB/NOP family class I SAM-dependent RNA methyltransferase [Euryarchaeota archaeon]